MHPEILCFFPVIFLPLLFWFLWSKFANNNKEAMNSKIYVLIQNLNCSKGEAKKILEAYEWNDDKVREIIKSSKKACPDCCAMNLLTIKFCTECGRPFSDEVEINNNILNFFILYIISLFDRI